MGREEDEAMRRPGRARPRQSQPQRASAKMKMASLMAAAEEDRSSDLEAGARGKRKRVKKGREDDWPQPQPQPQPQSQPRGPVAPARMAPASILNPAPAVATSSRFSMAAEAEAAASSVAAPVPSGPRGASLFHELPAVVPSFADAERRRPSSSSASTAPSAKSDAKAAAKHAISLYDLFFPDDRAAEPADPATVTTTAAARSMKRKRRGGRRTEDAVAELDLLRFGVDSVKLVPQGLVDRVDAQLSHSLRARVVASHVANWCRRAGFADGFLAELRTLLAAYYPCGYPTLLDQVVAGFLFQRPEFMALLLPAMLDKMLKSGEPIWPGKYPLADALARACAATSAATSATTSATTSASAGRAAGHELACVTLLRCLLERNRDRDRLVLSPCAAVCALGCSGAVLRRLWRALLLPVAGDAVVAAEDELWDVLDPTQQAVELLAEEQRQRSCRLSCALVELVLADEALQRPLLTAPSRFLAAQSLERAVTLASPRWSTAVLSAWLERRREAGAGAGEALQQLVELFVRLGAALSVKKTDWFATHVLRFVLSPACRSGEQERILRAVLAGHMPLLLGGTQEHAARATSTTTATTTATSNGHTMTKGSSGAESGDAELLTVSEVADKMALVLGLARAAGAATCGLFLDVWTQLWTLEDARVPWRYVLALLAVTLERDAGLQRLEKLATHVCRAYFRRLSDGDEDVATNFSEALRRLLPCGRRVAGALLADVVDALAVYGKTHALLAERVLGNAVTLRLARVDGVESGWKRPGGHQRTLLEDAPVVGEGDALEASNGDAQVLTALVTLAKVQDEAGGFVRRVLSSRALVRVLTSCLATARRRRERELLLDVMSAVVTRTEPRGLGDDWARQHVVHELVRCAYTAPPSVARRATSLLQRISRCSSSGARTLLWAVLQQCTARCCGCEDKENASDRPLGSTAGHGLQDTAGVLAELVQVMLRTVPRATLQDVLRFVAQKLSSCSAGGSRVNLFVLLLLRKLVLGELDCDAFLPVVQQAVCPLVDAELDQVRVVQLQLLKALCSRLVAMQLRPPKKTKKRGRGDHWQRCEDVLCSERLQADLRAITTRSRGVCGDDSDGDKARAERSSRAAVVLAEGILAFVRRLQREPRSRQDDGE